jgi:hypothetical protein
VVSSSRPKQSFRRPLWASTPWIWGVSFYPVPVVSDVQRWNKSAIARQSCCETVDFSERPRHQPPTEPLPNFLPDSQSVGCTALMWANPGRAGASQSVLHGQMEAVRTLSGRRLVDRLSPENCDLKCSSCPFQIDVESTSPNHPKRAPHTGETQTSSRIQSRCSVLGHLFSVARHWISKNFRVHLPGPFVSEAFFDRHCEHFRNSATSFICGECRMKDTLHWGCHCSAHPAGEPKP